MFSITYENRQNVKIVRLNGDLISDNIKLLDSDLISEEPDTSNYIFDLQELNMIDSTGLSYIINYLKRSIENNSQIKLLHLDNQPKLIFEITRVDTLFELYDNEKDALDSFIIMGENNESNITNMQQTA